MAVNGAVYATAVLIAQATTHDQSPTDVRSPEHSEVTQASQPSGFRDQQPVSSALRGGCLLPADPDEQAIPCTHPVRDRDTQPTGAFDAAFAGIKAAQTPARRSRADAYAQRLVKTVRSECTDRMIPAGKRHARGRAERARAAPQRGSATPGLDEAGTPR
jgi:hypothetical protein